MNDSTFLAQFYGPTLTWFAPIFGTVGLLAVLGNALMIWIALSTPSIRSVSSNWFIINMGVSDLLFGLNSSFLCGTAFICGGNGSCPMLAKICGGLADMTVITAM
uniref:G-protein coupled receptors family 1 profile domain-containing protein n=1 Tax=Plectus sambesii TaxID=2011161 RepID=A0A914W3F0_9BILA